MSHSVAANSRRNFLSSLAQTTIENTPKQTRNTQASQERLSRELVMPPLVIRVLNRAGFGHTAEDIADFEALAGNDHDRLNAWIDQQLASDLIDDSACDARIAAVGFEFIQKSRKELWLHYKSATNTGKRKPGYEVIALKFLRAMYSKQILKEVMVDFWHDHFSVFWKSGPGMSDFAHYDRECIRPNVFGNFRTMLGKVTKSTTMLYYLDLAYSNANSANGPNENFAREVLELHTLGAENYFGTIAPEEVPGYPNSAGYVEHDVFEVARALSGWTINGSTSSDSAGEFRVIESRHDIGEKQVLGHPIAAGMGALNEGENILTILSTHPGTATFIARKLCRRLVSDSPPESLVLSAANIFQTNIYNGDQLERVVRHILQSAEFRDTTWGQKTKRPFDILINALRAGGSDYTFLSRLAGDSWTNSLYVLFKLTGHTPFEWIPPNGYPDVGQVWRGSSTLVMRWRVLNWLVDKRTGAGAGLLPIIQITHASGLFKPQEIVDYWINRIYGYQINPGTRDHLIEFLAQELSPTDDLPLTWPIAWSGSGGAVQRDLWTRIPATVGLMFMSAEYQLK